MSPKRLLPILTCAASLLLGASGAALAADASAPGEPVDLVLAGGTVVTMDAGFHVFEQGAVAVRGERIVAVGPARDRARGFPPEPLRSEVEARPLLLGDQRTSLPLAAEDAVPNARHEVVEHVEQRPREEARDAGQ